MRVQNRAVLVTGGGSGIGAACSQRLAREGARVGVLDSNAAAARGVAEAIRNEGGCAVPLTADVTEAAQVEAAVTAAAERFGPIHGLVNNAGVAVRRPVGELEEADWNRVIDANLKGAFLCSKFALRHFAPEGGSIVHMSSVTGITGVRNRAAYSTAKGGLVALARSMALDYASRGIRVNAVCPGFVRTPLIAPLLADPERTARLIAMHPLGRLGEPEDIAAAVLFLLSDESAWMTGQALVVDGGFAAGHFEDI